MLIYRITGPRKDVDKAAAQLSSLTQQSGRTVVAFTAENWEIAKERFADSQVVIIKEYED